VEEKKEEEGRRKEETKKTNKATRKKLVRMDLRQIKYLHHWFNGGSSKM
jgi:hypothetical protein